MNPKTLALYETLMAAYPDKEWHLEPYKAYDHERHAIMFSHNGTSIHNPLLSENTISDQPDRYGLSEEHAKRMAAHNQSFEIHAMGATYDLERLFESIKDLALSEPSANAEDVLTEMGLYKYHTGGGCMSYAIFNPDDSHIHITDDDGSGLPATMGEAMIGLYDAEGETKKIHHPKA